MKNTIFVLGAIALGMMAAMPAQAMVTTDMSNNMYKPTPQAIKYNNANDDAYNESIQKRIKYINLRRQGFVGPVEQELRHEANMKQNNMNRRSTELSRTGEMDTVEGRRSYANVRYVRTNNTSVNMKRKSDAEMGQNIGTQNLSEGVTLGSDPKPDAGLSRIAQSRVNGARALTLQDLRGVQRASLYTTSNQVATGRQKNSTFWGKDPIKLFHPFMYGTQQ